jgi:prevent-host-death family protein
MTTRKPPSHAAESVGIADLRANLAKYLKLAAMGRPVIVRERGRAAYVLTRYQEQEDEVFGCMRERTQYTEGTVLNADESWPPGAMP